MRKTEERDKGGGTERGRMEGEREGGREKGRACERGWFTTQM